MMTKRITIIEVKDYVGQEVTIGAWVANKSGKGKIAFLQLRDGTAFFQGVAFKPNFIEKFGEEVGLEKFDTIKRLSQETSVFVTGIVKEDERSKLGYELDITDIEVIGESQDYPITPKEHGTDFLMDNRHLWLRSRKQVAVMQIRNAIIYATYEFFDKNGFMKFDSPILSGNAAEDSKAAAVLHSCRDRRCCAEHAFYAAAHQADGGVVFICKCLDGYPLRLADSLPIDYRHPSTEKMAAPF